MLKQIIICSVFTSILLNATSVESEVGINIGMDATKNSDGSKFENPTLGVTYQNNTYVVMPRVDLEYVKIKDDHQVKSLLKGSFNGVYEFENSTNTSPYFVAGGGYESVQSAKIDEFESHPFVQAGIGVNIVLKNEWHIKFESKILQIIGGNNENNEIILTGGMSFPFGYSEPRRVNPQPRPRAVYFEPLPVVTSFPVSKEVVTPPIEPLYINKNECSIKIDLPDLDRDGVEDSIDQCPATPCNFTVDNYGCPIKTTLKVNFATNSAIIEYDSMIKVDRFAQFLLRNKGSLVKIVGHTDNVGTESNNLSLSIKRANSVMQALIMKGVSSARLTAEGKGESMPLSSNDTYEGRATNRRIEAELSYPIGRD